MLDSGDDREFFYPEDGVGEDAIREYEQKEGVELDDFYKIRKDSKIWYINERENLGSWLFSFDRKRIYNLWSDWHLLTEEQKKIFAEEDFCKRTPRGSSS